jgi:putative flippase GtrA
MMAVNVSVFATLTASGLLPVVAQTLTTGCMFILNFYGSRRFTFAGAAAKP